MTESSFKNDNWQVPRAKQLVWHRWEDEAVVHDPQSGETHYLNMMAMVALEMLEEGARSVDGLAQSMASYFEIVVDETLQGRASALVARFDELGLILPCRT